MHRRRSLASRLGPKDLGAGRHGRCRTSWIAIKAGSSERNERGGARDGIRTRIQAVFKAAASAVGLRGRHLMREYACVISAQPEVAEEPSGGTRGNWQQPIPCGKATSLRAIPVSNWRIAQQPAGLPLRGTFSAISFGWYRSVEYLPRPPEPRLRYGPEQLSFIHVIASGRPHFGFGAHSAWLQSRRARRRSDLCVWPSRAGSRGFGRWGRRYG